MPKIVVVGLGYVGLPLAVALARKFDVIGYDVDPDHIAELRRGYDRTREVPEEELLASTLQPTDRPETGVSADIYIKYFSPWLDVLIAFRTIKTVLTGWGAR